MPPSSPPTLQEPQAAHRLLCSFVEERHPAESWRPLDDDPLRPQGQRAWVLRHQDSYCLLRVPDIDSTMLSIRAGVAMDIPRSEEPALYVAALNKQVMAGRAYMAYGDELAFVVHEETIWGRALSWEFEPGLIDFVTRFEYVVRESVEIGQALRSRFGGRPFHDDEWFHLVL